MAIASDVDNKESPPPYSPQNSNNSCLQPPVHSAPYGLPRDHHVYTTSQLSDELGAATLGERPSLTSAIPSLVAPLRIISHRLKLHSDTNPDEIRIPSSFAQRQVSEQDWFTFRNNLFPPEFFSSKSQQGSLISGRREKASIEREAIVKVESVSKSGGTQGNEAHDEAFIQRQRIHKVVQQWNVGFFEPRGLVVIAKVLPSPSSPKGSEINSHSLFSKTILGKAATRGDYSVVEELLLRGADPDIQPFNGSPALYHAAVNGYFSVVELLLQHGATTDTKPSVLHYIASEGNVSALSTLLKYGADPNHKSWTASSPLFEAARRSDIPILELLLAYGADPDYTNTGGNSALYHAIKKRETKIVQTLLDHGADPNQRPWTGQSCIHLAVSQGDTSSVEALLATERTDINVSTPMTHTPLGTAISLGDIEMARLLVNHGAKLNVKTMGSQTPIFLAASGNNVPLLRLLLQKSSEQDVDINDFPPGYRSPLYMAILRQDLPIAQALLEFKADPNSGNALTVAVDSCDTGAVQLLLSHGADPNLKPNGRQYPYYDAAARGDVKILELLVNSGANVNLNSPGYPSALLTAVLRGDEKIVSALLEAGADPEGEGPGGVETIREFVAKNGGEVVKGLFEKRRSD